MRPRGLTRVAVVSIPLLAALLGCGTFPSELPVEAWSHPDPSSGRFEADHDTCVQAATGRAPLVTSRGNVLATEVDEARFERCMGERGWSRSDD